jgi:TctA family transporter
MDPFFAGLIAVFQWPALGYLVLGVLLGIWLGAVPGLGGIIGLVLLLPFTFGMDSVSAFALLLGMYAVTTTSDTIASVLLGIPGTAASQATILDGFPLAQQGQAARAFGAAFTVSAFGGVFGALILAVSLPIALPLILAFRSPEIFMLGVLGLTMVGSLSGGSVLKGLIAALLGLMMAPETANNATKGGALIPTVAFGIPGSLGTAILLGALLIQGLTPGPTMLTTELSLTYSMVWTIVIANVLAAGLLMIWSRQVAKLAFLPGHLIVPGVILFVFMGAWISGASIGDWVTCFVMGVIGTIMKRSGWPRPPLVLALILGAILENAFQLSMRAHSGVGWLQGPVVLIILAITILTLALAVRGMIKTRKNDDAPEVGEGSERNPMISLPFSAILLALFVWAAIEALAWPPTVRQLPLTIAVPAIALAFWVLIRDLFEAKAEIRAFGGLRPALLKAADIGELPATGAFLGYVLVMLLLTPFVGQIVALAAFMAVYLWRWGGYGWKVSLAYTAGGVAFLYGFYGKIIHVLWYPSMLFG